MPAVAGQGPDTWAAGEQSTDRDPATSRPTRLTRGGRARTDAPTPGPDALGVPGRIPGVVLARVCHSQAGLGVDSPDAPESDGQRPPGVSRQPTMKPPCGWKTSIRRAASLVAQGNLSKAMEMYAEALGLAPQHAETYRQRALTLLRLGDRVQAQTDYAQFLALDPQARTRVQEEIQLFSESGYAQVERNRHHPARRFAGGGRRGRTAAVVESKPFRPAEQSDMDYALARDAFVRGNYCDAYQWAQRADRIMPQARVHAIMAQALFAQGAYRGAAAEARAAATHGTGDRLADAPTASTIPRWSDTTGSFTRSRNYVRRNPSSADGRFLLGYEHSDSRAGRAGAGATGHRRRSRSLGFRLAEHARARRGGDRAR